MNLDTLKRIKQEVATEGLILLCLVIISASLSLLFCKFIAKSGKCIQCVDAGGSYDLRIIMALGYFAGGYILRILIGFIIWAVKTLRIK